MSKKKNGLTPKQREDVLRGYGFVPKRDGKGSHEMWEHPALKMLARRHKIDPPLTYLSTPTQKAWDMLVCDNPASGTWINMVKHAAWCAMTCERIQRGSVYEQQRVELAAQFRKSVGEYGQWKKEIKHRLKAGLAPSAPPITYKDLVGLKPKT